MPELAKGLQQVLEYQGDVESTFVLHFEVEYDYFGELRTQELRPGGSEVDCATSDDFSVPMLMPRPQCGSTYCKAAAFARICHCMLPSSLLTGSLSAACSMLDSPAKQSTCGSWRGVQDCKGGLITPCGLS